MLSTEDKALSMFNRALKEAISLNLEPNKNNAKEIVLNDINVIKEALYDCTLIDDRVCKKSIEYYNNIKTIIEKL